MFGEDDDAIDRMSMRVDAPNLVQRYGFVRSVLRRLDDAITKAELQLAKYRADRDVVAAELALLEPPKEETPDGETHPA